MKRYLVTRRDLPPGAQASQLVHACRAFVAEHPEEDRRWYETSNTVVLLTERDDASLQALLDLARRAGVSTAAFHEPDYDYALTAIALGANGKRLCRKLPKAFK